VERTHVDNWSASCSDLSTKLLLTRRMANLISHTYYEWRVHYVRRDTFARNILKSSRHDWRAITRFDDETCRFLFYRKLKDNFSREFLANLLSIFRQCRASKIIFLWRKIRHIVRTRIPSQKFELFTPLATSRESTYAWIDTSKVEARTHMNIDLLKTGNLPKIGRSDAKRDAAARWSRRRWDRA